MQLRKATFADQPAIEQLISLSTRTLSAGDYSSDQIEGALKAAMGLDTQLIRDGTYFVVMHADTLMACGGWSYRSTLFGNNREAGRSAETIDPASGAARIRAFFVHPDHARKGLGTRLMQACEQAARARGYRRLELMATLPGERLYLKHGFTADNPVEYPLDGGLTITFVPMHRVLGDAGAE